MSPPRALTAMACVARTGIGTNTPLRRALVDLREHAILALRNILAGNLENQAVVDAVRPVGRWDEDKVLREVRGDAEEA